MNKTLMTRFSALVAAALLATQLAACSPVDTVTPVANAAAETSAPVETVSPTTAAQTGATDVAQADTVDAAETDAEDEDVARPEGWTEATHSKNADPDYATVFPQDEVNEITITIDADEWQLMMEDMENLYGEGEGGTGDRGDGDMQPDGGQVRPQADAVPAADGTEVASALPADGVTPPTGMQAPGGADELKAAGATVPGDTAAGVGAAAAGGVPEEVEENPMWGESTITFEDGTWTNVAVRFKGNSSLRSLWGAGTTGLPLKLDFDEFEDEYPEIDDQRFYGFKQLSLSPNWSDVSYLREKVTADVFREAGVPAAETAFYAVYVDHGEGAEFWGLYAMVEVVDDTVIETQFDDDSGNVYKPTGSGATFSKGSFSEASFDKETNDDEADYSDILALYDALHADTRTTDPEAWREGLEAVFDVDEFLRYLATNTLVQNWDTYGVMNHNYYLYNDPTTGLLTWIPWDNNMALSSTLGGGGNRGVLALDLASVGNDWPLISYLMDDTVYHAQYVQNVDEVANGAFSPERMTAIYDELAELIAPYVEQMGVADARWQAALDELDAHVQARYEAAVAYVASQSNGQ